MTGVYHMATYEHIHLRIANINKISDAKQKQKGG